MIDVLAIFEFGNGNLGTVSKVSVLVQDFVYFVLDLRFQIQINQQLGDKLRDVLGFTFRLHYLVLDRLLDLPEYVAVFNVFEDQLRLLLVAKGHVGAT